ncbi:MATE family efflux transporter [Thiothrix nivea]|uniref:MATE efflux family protein n=1 Tax=Thiothrix nivea (strain ATCC 35100 / DSM 5205 / JP2) TaxID=870187 RepID=A0A656HK55_THINJ|nr:MATE family efflux transporter [Thiothrix nivea]EIJ36857.1 MATE efflux family protein [Thiothrix nivea DSM 5205]
MIQRDLTHGSERQHLLAMSIPTIWGILAIMAMHLADTWYVGQLGTDALAAMGFTFPVVMIIGSLAFGVGTGTSAVIAQAIGSERTDWVRSYSTQSLIIALAIALVFAVVGLLTLEPVFRLLGAPERLLPLIRDYMGVWYLGGFLVVVPMVGNAGIRAAGNTRLPSYVMMGVALTNLVLDPVFIFGLFGFPRMELQGAALATLCAYVVACTIMLYVLGVKLKFLSLQALRQGVVQSWRDILRIAVPSAGTNLIAPVATAITTWLIAQYGADAIAGYSIAARIESLGLIAFGALATSLAPFAGQNWGARKLDRLNRALDLSFRFAWLWGLLFAVLLWVAAEPLIGLFTRDPEAIAAAKHYLYIVPVTFGLLGTIMMTSSVSNGTGNPHPALLMTLLRLLLVYLPLAWLLSQWLGLEGIFLANAVANVLVGVGAFLWIKRKCRRGTNARQAEQRRKAMWEERYATDEYLFGTEPNDFLREHAAELPVGDTLSIGEGEGRNAVFLAGLGHRVTALDASAAALEKARKLAREKQVDIETVHNNLDNYRFEARRWDTVVSIFCHMPVQMRRRLHQQVVKALRPGGIFILEAYTPAQLKYGTGGPPVEALMMNLASLREELKGLEFIHALETTREIHEGKWHHGMSAVVQVIARRVG